eukprot:gene3354-3630_t
MPAARAASLLMLMLLACGTQQLPSLNLGPPAAAALTQDLALWNKAYQLIVENIPVRPESPQAHDASQSMAVSGATADPSNWDTALSIPSSCSSSGYGTIDPATVPLNACFYKKNGFCTPGASAGLDKQWQSGSPITCESVKVGLTADGAVPANRSAVFAAGRPGTGHYIAVFTRASGCAVACWESDYHMLRQDSNGQWSYKEPGGPAKNVDLFNSVITDPETAVIPGRYTFCAYFLVDLSNMKVGGTFGDTTLKEKEHQCTPGGFMATSLVAFNLFESNLDHQQPAVVRRVVLVNPYQACFIWVSFLGLAYT